MKRKVIQIAQSTQLISLPRKWALEHGVKKGDELDIEVQGNNLIVSTGMKATSDFQRLNLDITGLDRSSILYVIRAAYRKGYEEIELRFDNAGTWYFRVEEEVSVVSAIHEEVRRLIGIELVEQKPNSCLIKLVSEVEPREFDTLLRRIFLLLIGACTDLVEGIEKKDTARVGMIEEKHDTATKFVSYLLRVLNKRGHPTYHHPHVYYHLIASLDTVMDSIKYAGREYRHKPLILAAKELQILKDIATVLELYAEFFYKLGIEKVKDIYVKRDKILKDLWSNAENIPSRNLLILQQMEQILEIIIDAVEERMVIFL